MEVKEFIRYLTFVLINQLYLDENKNAIYNFLVNMMRAKIYSIFDILMLTKITKHLKRDGGTFMADIRLVRVDFRLMHGQVIAAWMNQVDGNAIMIINDQLAGDSFMKD